MSIETTQKWIDCDQKVDMSISVQYELVLSVPGSVYLVFLDSFDAILTLMSF